MGNYKSGRTDERANGDCCCAGSGTAIITAQELEAERQSEFLEQVLITHTVLGKVGFPRNAGIKTWAGSGYTGKVKRVLQHGVDLNARSEDGMTAMEYAVRRGKEDVIQLLLRAGAE